VVCALRAGYLCTVSKPRLIALGASNLTRILPKLLQVAMADAGGPIDALVALGLGRSYGVRSRLLCRELPGMHRCGLWPALAEAAKAQAAPATGIITDVGNDIFYGIEPATVLGWVDAALQRLRPMVGRLVVTGVPDSVFDLGVKRFAVMRRVLVPSCTLQLAEGKRRAAALHEGLRELSERHGAVFLEFPKHWYGWDAIHVKRRYWRSLSEQLLFVPRDLAVPSIAGWRVRMAAPEVRWLFQAERRTRQPALTFGDGTTVSLY
jgi:hypothetical protein